MFVTHFIAGTNSHYSHLEDLHVIIVCRGEVHCCGLFIDMDILYIVVGVRANIANTITNILITNIIIRFPKGNYHTYTPPLPPSFLCLNPPVSSGHRMRKFSLAHSGWRRRWLLRSAWVWGEDPAVAANPAPSLRSPTLCPLPFPWSVHPHFTSVYVTAITWVQAAASAPLKVTTPNCSQLRFNKSMNIYQNTRLHPESKCSFFFYAISLRTPRVLWLDVCSVCYMI